jgi:pyruvate dehydrogenase E1 component
LRLTTRPIDHAPFDDARARLGESLREHVLAGGYRLREPSQPAESGVVLVASGPVVAECLTAADLLEVEGVSTTVIDVTSASRLYRGWRDSCRDASRSAVAQRTPCHLATLLTRPERTWPIVTVQDAASHALAWLGSVNGTRVVPVGVDEFGQSGTIEELYGHFDLLPDQLVNAGLLALEASRVAG